jgi:hypothetical protein
MALRSVPNHEQVKIFRPPPAQKQKAAKQGFGVLFLRQPADVEKQCSSGVNA